MRIGHLASRLREWLRVLAQPGVREGENQHGSTRNEDDVHLLSLLLV